MGITFIWSGDPAKDGLWEGDKLLATTGQLERAGYGLDYMLTMSQQQLEHCAGKIKRDTALPVYVNSGNIEDFLG